MEQDQFNQQEMSAPSGGKAWMGWVVGIFLVILVGGGLYYYYQYIKIPELNKKVDDLQLQVDQLQNASTKWNTFSYTIPEFAKSGLKIQYPDNFTITNGGAEEKDGLVGWEVNGDPVMNLMPVGVSKTEWINTVKKNMTNVKESQVQVASRSATLITGTFGIGYGPGDRGAGGSKGRYIIFQSSKDNEYYTISFEDDGEEDAIAIFDQILEKIIFE